QAGIRLRAAARASGAAMSTPRAEARTAICRLSTIPWRSSCHRVKSGGKRRATNFAPCSRPTAKRAGVNSRCEAAKITYTPNRTHAARAHQLMGNAALFKPVLAAVDLLEVLFRQRVGRAV